MGRAARNINGQVIMFADNITKSMKAAITETNRRRKIQIEYTRLEADIPLHKAGNRFPPRTRAAEKTVILKGRRRRVSEKGNMVSRDGNRHRSQECNRGPEAGCFGVEA